MNYFHRIAGPPRGHPSRRDSRSYIGKIELYNGEKVAYLGDTIDGDFATVRTKLVTKQTTEVRPFRPTRLPPR